MTPEATARTFLVTGATGFIGTALVRELLARGESVVVLTRSLDKAHERLGPQVRALRSLQQIEDGERFDGVVNLAGAGILALPWVEARRRVLLESRLGTTREVAALCRRLQQTPAALVSGSAIGFYGARAEEECTESTPPAQGQFQSELCQRWEAAALEAQPLGVRVVLLRTGLVLGTSGGALPMMSLPVRLFAGGIIASGRQWVSWIHLQDIVRLILFALDRASVRGPLNAAAPQAVRHADFQKALARQLHRPLWSRVPAWLLRPGLGEMSELLTGGQRVVPREALAQGFQFRYPELEAALRALFEPAVGAAS